MEKEMKIRDCGDTCGTPKENNESMAPKELSKEQLTGMLHQLSEQDRKLFEENKKLRQVIEDMNMANLFKRLDYLFRVITEDNKYLSEDFKKKCSKEIEYLITQPEESETSEE